jgi:FG-GAP repeat
MKTILLLLAGLSCVTLASEAPAPENPPQGLSSSDWSSIRAAYEAGRHAVQRQEDGTLTARNPGQQWRTEFDGKGFTVTPDHGQWTWGLELTACGERTLLSASSSINHDGGKITCQRDENLTEWFINDTRGLEQGWTISSRSVGVSPTSENLTLTLALRGDLIAQVSQDSSSVSFQTPSGGTALTYGGLKAWDADGKTLAVRFEDAGGKQIRIAVDDQNARYPITIDPIAQQAYLKAGYNGSATNDEFGTSVSVSGDTVVIGAPREDSGTTGVNNAPDEYATDSGAAYVFVRSGTTWTQQAFLKASNTGADDLFGTSVAVSGDTVIVGAIYEASSSTGVNSSPNENATRAGAAYIFVRSGTTWTQQAYLKASNAGAFDEYGGAVAVSGDTVVVGARNEDSSSTGVNSVPNENAGSSGAAYVFVRNGSTWSQQAYLKPGAIGIYQDLDRFGTSVAVAGDTVIIGAPFEYSSTTGVNPPPNEDASNSGAAYVFVRSGTTWTQQAFLKASNTGESDNFGWSVALSGDTAVVGAIGEDSSTTGVNSAPNENSGSSGAVYVFLRSGTAWSQQAYLKASNTGSGDQFGYSVAISGDTVVAGSRLEDSGTTGVNSAPNENASESGAAYVFARVGGIWSQQAYLKPSNTSAGDVFGAAVAVSGDTVMIGAYQEDSNTSGVNSTAFDNSTTFNAGAGYVFTRSGGVWSQQAYLKASNTPIVAMSGAFGHSVAVSGDTVIIGAPFDSSSTTGVNSVPNLGASSSGAAYVFVRSAGAWSQQAYLKASNTGSGDQFGYSVSISGDTLVVGAWLEDSGTTGVNSTPDESASQAGAAYLFVRSGTTWSQQAYLKASNTGAGDLFGYSVGVSGDMVVVGAFAEGSSTTGVNSTPNENAQSSGAAYVFARNGTAWSQQAYLKASNTGEIDYFGHSVATSGDVVVVGALNEDSGTTGVNSTPDESAGNSGAAYVFARSGTTWSQQAYLKPSNTVSGDNFGYSVTVSGNTVVVGSPGEDSSTTGVNSTPNESAGNSGAAYVFQRSGTTWSQQAYLKASNTGVGDVFGMSVAVSGDTLVIGAKSEDSGTSGVDSTPDNALGDSGAAYVFVRSSGVWAQQAYLKASNPGATDEFGGSVAVSGDTVIIGARYEDSGTAGVNSTPNESANNSGAAYIFNGLGPVVLPPEIAIQAGTDMINGTTKGFGPVVVGTTSDLIFTISNTGAGELTLTGTPEIALSGSSDFTVTAQPSSPITGPGGSSDFTVRFSPTGSGLKTASLSIPNNDGDENPFVIQLTGTAATALVPVSFHLSTSPSAAALQFDVGFTVAGVSLGTPVLQGASSHQMSTELLANGKTRFVINPITNTAIPPTATIEVMLDPGNVSLQDGIMTISGVVATNSSGTPVSASPGAKPIILNVSPSSLTKAAIGTQVPVGVDVVDLDGSITMLIYRLNGSPIGSAFGRPFTTSLTSATPGDFGFSVFFQDNAGNSGGSLPVTLRFIDPASLSTYSSFQSAWLDGAGDFTADPYNTGIPNGLAWALGINPLNPDRSRLPVQSIEESEGEKSLVYRARVLASGVAYQIRTSNSLDAGSWSPLPPAQIEETLEAGGWKLIEASAPITEADPLRFIQLSVENP